MRIAAALRSQLQAVQGVTAVEDMDGGLRVIAHAQDGLMTRVVVAGQRVWAARYLDRRAKPGDGVYPADREGSS